MTTPAAVVRTIGLGAIVLALLLPLSWALLGSLTPEDRLFAGEASPELVLDHYRALFAERDFWTPVRNSLIVALLTTSLALTLGAPCAYALVRLPFPRAHLALPLLLSVSMFPPVSMVPALYLMLRAGHLLDTQAGLVIANLTFAVPLAVWLLAGYLRHLPRELEEAAVLDGASRVQVLWRVVLPLAGPGLATTGILVFLYCWNEFLFALSFTLGPERYTVPVAITLFRGQYQVPWGQVLAASATASAVVALVVVLAQRRIVGGLTAGAVKG